MSGGLHSVRAELHPPHPGECECWQCAEWRLRHAHIAGLDIVIDAIFGTGAPALHLVDLAEEVEDYRDPFEGEERGPA